MQSTKAIVWFDYGNNFEDYNEETLQNYIKTSGDNVLYKILSECEIQTKKKTFLIENYLKEKKAEKSFAFSKFFQDLTEINENYSKISENYINSNCYLSDSNYVEYIKGNMNLVILTPHGGKIKPPNIADRVNGVKESNKKKIIFLF